MLRPADRPMKLACPLVHLLRSREHDRPLRYKAARPHEPSLTENFRKNARAARPELINFGSLVDCVRSCRVGYIALLHSVDFRSPDE